jgi:hypothetical protein
MKIRGRTIVLVAAVIMALAGTASPAQAMHYHGSKTPATASCTGGSFDYGTRPSPVAWAQVDWEILSSCSTQIRVKVISALGFTYRSGWVKSLELASRATATDGSSMREAWVEARYTGSTGDPNCQKIYPVTGTWALCNNP